MLSCSVVSDSVTLWTYSLLGSSVHRDPLGQNTGVGCHAFLQGIFPTQGLKPGLSHCRQVMSETQRGSLYSFNSLPVRCLRASLELRNLLAKVREKNNSIPGSGRFPGGGHGNPLS